VLCVANGCTEVQGQDYTASKSIYEHLIAVQGRHVWVGALIGQVCENSITNVMFFTAYTLPAQRTYSQLYMLKISCNVSISVS
jgi:hypothetical protein